MIARSLLPASFVISFAACASTPPKPAVLAPDAANATPTRPVTTAGKSPERALVRIDDQIRHACGISDDDAYFAFDSAKLLQREQGVLHRVAVCFESGPLSGRSMRLVGHADPRGSAEYNLVLGGSRADAVKSYLHHEGMADGKMATTSRGDLDASGKDESGWAKDRRVDILLAN